MNFFVLNHFIIDIDRKVNKYGQLGKNVTTKAKI